MEPGSALVLYRAAPDEADGAKPMELDSDDESRAVAADHDRAATRSLVAAVAGSDLVLYRAPKAARHAIVMSRPLSPDSRGIEEALVRLEELDLEPRVEILE